MTHRRSLVVSVVTRGTSDDAKGASIEPDGVYLRVSKHGPAFTFHYSLDGVYWTLHRYFSLRDRQAPLSVGFLAQAPTGDGCLVQFDEITLSTRKPGDPRDGS